MQIHNHISDQDELLCQIVSVDGKLIWSQNSVAEQTQLNIEDLPEDMCKFLIQTETEDLQNLEKGTYIVQLTLENKAYAVSFVKE
ncbi:MAG: T9SS type A sorting domain-containing protein [Bacteroidia bacterium]